MREAIDGITPVAPPLTSHARDGRWIDGLVGRCGGDVEFARELLGSFAESVPASASGIDSALRSGETGRLAFEVHGLKGACLTIGADDLAEACRRLEDAGRGDDLDAVGEASRGVLGGLAGLSASIAAYLGAGE